MSMYILTKELRAEIERIANYRRQMNQPDACARQLAALRAEIADRGNPNERDAS